MNCTVYKTKCTNIRAGIRSKGKEWQIKQVVSLRKWFFCSTRPTCLEAATKFKTGVVGRDATWSPIQANSPSPAISTIWNPQSIYIWYILCIAAQTSLTLWLIRWVTVVKHIFLLYIIKKKWPLTKKVSMLLQTYCWSCSSSLGTFTKLCSLQWPVFLTVLPFSPGTGSPSLVDHLSLINCNGTTATATNL